MVSIRLSRAGARNRPFYHLVVTDSRNRRDGRYIERLGFFNPVARGREEELRIDVERVQYWISQGARPSPRVASLLKANEKGEVGRDRERSREKPASVAAAPAAPADAAESAEAVSEEALPAAEAAAPAPQASEEEPEQAAGTEESTDRDAAADSEKE